MLQPLDQPSWLVAGWAELGQRETAGTTANPRIRDLFADARHPEIKSDEVAWCAAFVGACLERSGVPSTRSLLARSYLTWGDELPSPRLGAIAVLSRDPDPAAGHVAFVIGETDGSLILLGGNQSNAVTVQAFPKSTLISLRWPILSPPATSRGVAQGDEPLPIAPPAPSSPMSGFDRALAHVLEMEGGYTDDPADPGGPTNWGITLADFARARSAPITPANRDGLIAALRAIGPAEIRAIYDTRYWQASGAASLPSPLALFHFDTAVNMGTGTAIRMLQTSLGVLVDGEIGPETLDASRRSLPAAILETYADLRRRRYRSLATFPRFGRGWLARVDTTLALAISLSPTQGPSTMSTDQSQFPTQPKWWGQSITIWGAVVTGLAAVLPAISPALGVDISASTVHTAADQVGAVVQAAAGLAGTLAAIYGRLRASQPLEQRPVTLKI